jgi:archaellum component FlaG (FlaF/FlaG flagellin family)
VTWAKLVPAAASTAKAMSDFFMFRVSICVDKAVANVLATAVMALSSRVN